MDILFRTFRNQTLPTSLMKNRIPSKNGSFWPSFKIRGLWTTQGTFKDNMKKLQFELQSCILRYLMTWRRWIISSHTDQCLSWTLGTSPEVVTYLWTTVILTSSIHDALALSDKYWTSCIFLSIVLFSTIILGYTFKGLTSHKITILPAWGWQLITSYIKSTKVPVRPRRTWSGSK